MKNNIQNPRRQFLTQSFKGSALILGGLSSAGMLLESFTTSAEPTNEAEFRTQLAPLGNLSLTTSLLALTKANDPKVKMFANFETEEQKTISKILQELKTPIAPADAKANAVLDKLKAASGIEFDKAYMQAQVDTHEQLKALTASYITTAVAKTNLPEVHTRHLASLSLATITEHAERGKLLLGELK